MIIVQTGGDPADKRVLLCEQDCTVQRAPVSVADYPLFDGDSWYYYGAPDALDDEKDVELRRRNGKTGEEQSIISTTSLVTPRSSIISPDGSQLAYWLDNRQSDKGLTELWVYDAANNGTRVLAEKLVAPDIVTRARWNRFGTALWFLADSGKGADEKLEFISVNVQPPQVQARFKNLPLDSLRSVIDHGVMDLSSDAAILAFVQSEGRQDKLVVINDEQSPRVLDVKGNIPFLQWQGEDKLIYAVQSGSEFVFWRLDNSGRQVPLARLPGVLRSAMIDTSSRYLAFLASTSPGSTRRYVVDLSNGAVGDQGVITPYGKYAYVVQATLPAPSQNDVANNISAPLTDGQLVAFITNHLGEIVSSLTAQAERIVVTDLPNAAYLDYAEPGKAPQRLLVLVNDAIHAEWSVLARYAAAGAEWQKVQGGGLNDPKPARLYEWEASVQQWVLKQ